MKDVSIIQPVLSYKFAVRYRDRDTTVHSDDKLDYNTGRDSGSLLHVM